MPKGKPTPIGPMRMQPVEPGSIVPTQVLPLMPAVGRRTKEDAATKKTTNKGGSNPRRKSEDNAAEFPPKAAGSSEG